MKENIFLLSLSDYPIFLQLQLEEALLKGTSKNICLINKGTCTPSIVMGIGGKAEEHVKRENSSFKIPLIRRFSGGGTVIVDEGTFFITFIFNHSLFSFPLSSQAVLEWSETLYKEVFDPLPFQLKSHDYALGLKKCGGNAQYLKKERWLHHTSFLWEYKKERMDLLTIPKKQPEYRNNRDHEEFLTTLSPLFSSMEEIELKIVNALRKTFCIEKASLEEVQKWEKISHHQSTILL